MSIRDELVSLALQWEKQFGMFPGQAGLTAAVSEYDAAMLLGYNEIEYSDSIRGRTSVSRGYDFIFRGNKIQVKGNRPSGKPGSKVWNAGPKVKTVGWDYLIYILYDQSYNIVEAWQFDSTQYNNLFQSKLKLRLDDMRLGTKITN